MLVGSSDVSVEEDVVVGEKENLGVQDVVIVREDEDLLSVKDDVPLVDAAVVVDSDISDDFMVVASGKPIVCGAVSHSSNPLVCLAYSTPIWLQMDLREDSLHRGPRIPSLGSCTEP